MSIRAAAVLARAADVGPTVPLAALILGRDVALSLSAFYFRFASLPPPVRTPTLDALLKS